LALTRWSDNDGSNSNLKINAPKFSQDYPPGVSEAPSTAKVLVLMSLHNKRLVAL